MTASLVGTTTTYYTIAYSCVRKCFHANGRFWVFYSDGYNMIYKTSTDGATWTDPTIIGACSAGYGFSVWFDGKYLHYVLCYPSDTPTYRRGEPMADGSITWSAPEQICWQLSGHTSHIPSISVDSNGYPFIAFLRGTVASGEYYFHVTKSSKNDGTWETSPGFPYQLQTVYNATLQDASIIPLANSKMYVAYNYDAMTMKGRLWDGSSWGDEEIASVSNLKTAACFSVVGEGDDVHLTFTNTNDDVIYVKRTYGVGWGSEIVVHVRVAAELSLIENTSVLSIDGNGILYCFWIDSPIDNHIFYKKRVDGVWDTIPTDLGDTGPGSLIYFGMTCYCGAYDGYVGLLYYKYNSVNDVKHDFLSGLTPYTPVTEYPILPGPSGFALEFNGVDTYVEVADSPSLDIVNQLTIEAWIYLDDVDPTPDWRTIIAKLAPQFCEAYGFLTTADQNQIFFYTQGEGISFVTDDIQKNKWIHVVGTFTTSPGDNIYLYVDGSLRGYGEVSHDPIVTSDLPLVIGGGTRAGNSYAPYHFKGIIDEIRIYNRLLDATEVQEHYNRIFNDETGLVALWHLDEGSGNVTADASGNENNGTLFNNPQWIEIGIPPSLCMWLSDHGAPLDILITDVFAVINSYLFETSPEGYAFVPTLQNVFGVIDYYFGFDGDAATGCDFFT